MPRHNAKPERNAELYRRWLNGEDLMALAKEYGIGRARAYVIVQQERQRMDRVMWLEDESRHG